MQLLGQFDDRRFAELLAEHGGGLAFGRILSLVAAAGCKSVAVEETPTEAEYAAEHQALYKNVMSVDDSGTPVRFHFFEGVVHSLEEVKDNDTRYLGYCDLRPVPTRTISNALIDRRVFVKSNRDFLFLICQREFNVPFHGRTLKVTAFPYIQQDGAIVRCAQAALASIAQYYDTDLTGPRFTEIGASYPSGARSIPSPGLIPQQIGMGMQQMGFEPIIYEFSHVPQEYKEVLHCEQIIYRYVESGIPVLIGVDAGRELHALVVIGHTFTPDSWLAQTRTAYYERPKSGWTYHCSTTWIERFVVQDDNLGPYMLAPSDFIQYFACKLVVVPLPPAVYLAAEEAEVFAADFLSPTEHNVCRMLDDFLHKHEEEGKSRHEDTRFWYEQFRMQVERKELVLRTCLLDSAEWRRGQEQTEAYASYQSIIDQMNWPPLVWVIEISWPNIFLHSRQCCGEILLDPTTLLSRAVPTLEQAWIWTHVPGIIIHRDPKTGQSGVSVLEGRDAIRHHRSSTAK